jgi:DNA-binding NarL/FixJ family response regulator
VDREQPGSISTRKLVIETAKVNVITAYSGAEALEAIVRFPAVDGVVVDAGVPDVPCNELTPLLKEKAPNIPLIVVGTPTRNSCEGADHFLESFNPAKLLELLRGVAPKIDEIVQQDDKSSRESQE